VESRNLKFIVEFNHVYLGAHLGCAISAIKMFVKRKNEHYIIKLKKRVAEFLPVGKIFNPLTGIYILL